MSQCDSHVWGAHLVRVRRICTEYIRQNVHNTWTWLVRLRRVAAPCSCLTNACACRRGCVPCCSPRCRPCWGRHSAATRRTVSRGAADKRASQMAAQIFCVPDSVRPGAHAHLTGQDTCQEHAGPTEARGSPVAGRCATYRRLCRHGVHHPGALDISAGMSLAHLASMSLAQLAHVACHRHSLPSGMSLSHLAGTSLAQPVCMHPDRVHLALRPTCNPLRWPQLQHINDTGLDCSL